MPTPLRHQLHNEHHHCEFTASWDGRRCPHSRVATVQELGAAPSPHRVPGRLLGTSRKFALHTRAAAFQHDVGTQPGACCNTTGIPKESSPILQPELDKRGPFPSESALGRQGRQLKPPFAGVTGWRKTEGPKTGEEAASGHGKAQPACKPEKQRLKATQLLPPPPVSLGKRQQAPKRQTLSYPRVKPEVPKLQQPFPSFSCRRRRIYCKL